MTFPYLYIVRVTFFTWRCFLYFILLHGLTALLPLLSWGIRARRPRRSVTFSHFGSV